MDALARDHQAEEQETDRSLAIDRHRGRHIGEQRLVEAIVEHADLGGDGRVLRGIADGSGGKRAADEDGVGQFVLPLVASDIGAVLGAFGGQEPVAVARGNIGHHCVVDAEVAVGAIEDAGPALRPGQFERLERTAVITPQRKWLG